MASLEEGEMMPVQPEVEGFAELDPATISRVQDSGWTEMLMQSLNDLRVKNTLCDVLLVGQGGQAVNAHATLLAAASPRFHELLQKTQSKIILNMPTVAGEVLQSVVDFVYQGGAGIGNVQLPELQKFAGAFSMDNLYKACDSSVSLGDVGSESGMAVDGDVTALGGGNGFTAVGGEGDGAPIKKEPGIPVPVGKTPNIYDDDDDEAEPFAEDSTATAAAASEAADTDDLECVWLPKKVQEAKVDKSKMENMTMLQDEVNAVDSKQTVRACSRPTTEMATQIVLDMLKNCNATRETKSTTNVACSSAKKPVATRTNPKRNAVNLKKEKSGPDKPKVRAKITSTMTFACEDCGNVFSTKRLLKAHTDAHHSLPANSFPYNCKVCGIGMKARKNFLKHIKKKPCDQGQSAEDYKILPNPTGLHLCTECGQKFKKKSRYMVHMHRHEGTKPYNCKECGKGFYSKSSFTFHEIHHHDGTKPFTCDRCGQGFISKPSFNYHMSRHECDGDMDEEERSKLKSIVCEECGFSFRLESSLKKHILSVHRKVKKYSCKYCDATFSYSDTYKHHELKHTGERPCVCEYCGASFVEKKSLQRHVRIHTGERPYKCRYCSRSFNQRSSKKSHENRHISD